MPFPETLTFYPKNNERWLMSPVALFNIILGAAVAALLLIYVIQANTLAAAQFRAARLHDELGLLLEINSSLAARRSELSSHEVLTEFAQNRRMVQARGVTYLFDKGGVALINAPTP